MHFLIETHVLHNLFLTEQKVAECMNLPRLTQRHDLETASLRAFGFILSQPCSRRHIKSVPTSDRAYLS